jgi:DNA-directed RNA polymerase subunit L
MKVNILSKTKNELKIEVEGEGHTFCNILQKTLLKDSSVEFAGYEIPHPLTSNPIIYVRTKIQRSPERALANAAKKIGADAEEFRRMFEEAWKKSVKS